MKLLISGSSGLVGSHLCRELETDPVNQVVRLVRTPSEERHGTSLVWRPSDNDLPVEALTGLDAVIHLGGANIADKRWSPELKKTIYNSRVQSTQLLANALASMEKPPRIFLCASAIGFYGDRAEERLDELSNRGDGFLCDVCEAWEHATEPAVRAGIRVVNMRFGMILDKKGGALSKMLIPFKMGLGGRIGSGSQYWSWITLADVINGIQFCLQNEAIEGPVNFVAPEELTNLNFTKTMGNVLSRPTVLPVPAWVIKTLFGEMGQALMLCSARVTPHRLQSAGFEFQHARLDDALRAIL
ncbi:MAG: TIGR01777 family oxidoreductase [Planctomycetes bacterium]|nr:TIGR01777 family oxidoreductase [Planctomycetota bacterium]MCH9727799.1 TIGR01777 family oxidoreductase [Planctomycetota bacterium]MCH9776394.1 TIGR01777 family oxidoreductase [Planctomycetota bacterium]MCH9791594.1 TIGR01777 family oxidoreductase [Planctomycetota bacterium]